MHKQSLLEKKTGLYLKDARIFLSENLGVEVSEGEIYQAVYNGKLSPIKPFKRLIFYKEDLLSFINSSNRKGGTK